jgi:hypothetical protein
MHQGRKLGFGGARKKCLANLACLVLTRPARVRGCTDTILDLSGQTAVVKVGGQNMRVMAGLIVGGIFCDVKNSSASILERFVFRGASQCQVKLR